MGVKLSSILKGRPKTAEHRKHISESRKGKYTKEKNPFWGRKHTEEAKKKNREAHMGSKSHNWKGGVSLGYLRQFATRPQPKECEVCGGGGRIVFEHNHETGKFRGWLCVRCNWILGMAKDNGELLVMLKNYLEKNK